MPKSKSPESRAARKIIRAYLRHALVVNGGDDIDADTRAASQKRIDRLEKKLDSALNLVLVRTPKAKTEKPASKPAKSVKPVVATPAVAKTA